MTCVTHFCSYFGFYYYQYAQPVHNYQYEQQVGFLNSKLHGVHDNMAIEMTSRLFILL